MSPVFGIPLGVYQAVHRNSVADYVLTGVSFLGYSTPTFFLGRARGLVRDDSPRLPAVRAAVLVDPRDPGAAEALVLPVVTYAFLLYALWSRYMRSSVLDNLVQDYVRTARAKGASESRVVWGHVFRKSLVSIVTLLGLSLPALVGGAILIEVVSTTRAWDSRSTRRRSTTTSRAARVYRDSDDRDDRGEPAGRHRLRHARPEGEVLMSVREAQVIAATDAELGSSRTASRAACSRWEVFAENKLGARRASLHRLSSCCLLRRADIYVTDQTSTDLADTLHAVRRAPARLQRPRLRRARQAEVGGQTRSRSAWRRRSSRCSSGPSTARSPASPAGIVDALMMRMVGTPGLSLPSLVIIIVLSVIFTRPRP